jgi:hypothetical protein
MAGTYYQAAPSEGNMEKTMGNREFRNNIKPILKSGNYGFVRVMSDGGDRLHDGTNSSNEIGLLKVGSYNILQKVMLSSPKYHQRRKALTEMVSAWLDEGLGGQQVVPLTYAESFEPTPGYSKLWGQPKEMGRVRVCQVVHEYLDAMPGDEWRGHEYRRLGNLQAADDYCRSVIESHPDAERIALLDFLTINQDRSARNWITNLGERFYAIDNGMAWFHEYPHSDAWKIGTVIDDVLIQYSPWRFISGVFTTSYAGRRLSDRLKVQMNTFDWGQFCYHLDISCNWLDISILSLDWRFLGLKRRLEWIRDKGCFPTGDEYRGWLKNGSELMTPPEICATGGKVIWTQDEDR